MIGFIAHFGPKRKTAPGWLGNQAIPGFRLGWKAMRRTEKPFDGKGLASPGFVGRRSGSFVDSVGFRPCSLGSFVGSPGSFVVGCRRRCDKWGRMSRNLRHHECLCRSRCDSGRADVASDATTRAGMSHEMRQPGQRGAEIRARGAARQPLQADAISVRDGPRAGDAEAA